MDAAAEGARLANALAAASGHEVVAAYASVGGEPDTLGLIRELHRRGHRVLLPHLAARRTPTWGLYEDALIPGFLGIPEPPGPTLGSGALGGASFILTSALAVSADGVRLGTGGGWWDRALTHAHPDAVVATLVNDSEVLPHLPVEPWDVPVDLIITERRILPTGGRSEWPRSNG